MAKKNVAWKDRTPEYKKRHLQWARDRYMKDPATHISKVLEATRRLRAEALLAYGGKCVCCGEARYEFLAFDHVQNDGAKHRKTVAAVNLPRWLKKNNYPKTIQILCHNCNCAKQYYGICPHALERFQ